MKLCPGCGLLLPDLQLPPPARYQASGECWQLYQELSFYTLPLGDLDFSHQFSVDAYGAQHAGGDTKPITVAFSLIGLYLAVEGNYAGRQVQQAHLALAKRSKAWPVLLASSTPAALTVQDVLQAESGSARDAALRAWAAAVWESWLPTHELIKQLVEEHLHVRF